MQTEKINTELDKFDMAKKGIEEIKTKLNLVITDNDTRARKFTMSRDANGLRTQVNAKRLELKRPLTAKIKEIKEAYTKAIEQESRPLREAITAIEDYANNKLLAPLDEIISNANDSILAFDKTEGERRQKELDRIAKEEKIAEDARLKKIADDKVIEDKRIADEKIANDKKIAEQNKSGIQAKLAQKKIDDEVAANAKIAEDKRLEDERIENQRKQKLIDDKSKLNEKPKGTAKMVYTYELEDINLVPVEFLKRSVNGVAVYDAIKAGNITIPGLKITGEEKLGFR